MMSSALVCRSRHRRAFDRACAPPLVRFFFARGVGLLWLLPRCARHSRHGWLLYSASVVCYRSPGSMTGAVWKVVEGTALLIQGLLLQKRSCCNGRCISSCGWVKGSPTYLSDSSILLALFPPNVSGHCWSALCANWSSVQMFGNTGTKIHGSEVP